MNTKERIGALIPVKNLDRAKTRLADVLSPQERSLLVLSLLENVILALRSSGMIELIVVITLDDTVKERARAAGANVIEETGSGEDTLNRALEEGREWFKNHMEGIEALLVVPGDLPFLTARDIEEIVTLKGQPTLNLPAIVLAPDREGVGTNALLMRPPESLPFLFGTSSKFYHLSEAETRDLEVCLYYSPGTMDDLDTPADLKRLPKNGMMIEQQQFSGVE